MWSGSTCTCDTWNFWFLGWRLGNFLFCNNFLGNFRHLKDISSLMVRLMNSNGLKSSSKTEDTLLLKNEVRAKCTCGRWGFRFFGWCLGNFLFRNNFLGHLRHLKDISSFMVRLMNSNGLKSFSKTEQTFLWKNEVRAKCTCVRWGFWCFGWCLGDFLFWDDFLGHLRHLKGISSLRIWEF